MTDYLNKSIIEINNLLKNKTIKPIDLVNEAITKIEENSYNSFITLNKEEAIKKALELESKEVDNLYFGLPIAIKDNIVTKDIKTTCASLMLDNFIPIYDATVVSKIKEKNMIIIGKTNMDEFAMGSTGATSYYGAALNPWKEGFVPGGSSSGSAAAVSGRLVSLSLGSDTGGSIRQPASFCGLYGMKPTYGRVSRYGLIAFASSLDQIGPITHNLHDNALLLELISGLDKNDQTSSDKEASFTKKFNKDIKGMKIAVLNYYMSDLVDAEVKAKIEEVIEIIKSLGGIVTYTDIPYLEYAIPLYQTIALSEASSNLARFDGIKYGYHAKDYDDLDSMYKNTRSEAFGEEVKRRIMIGSYVLSGKNANIYYKKALKIRKVISNSFQELFNNYDLVIGPTNTNVSYKFETNNDALKSFYDDLLTIPVNMAGLPALSMPIGLNSNKLPIGMHIIGNHFNEDIIYQLASNIDKELNLNLDPRGEK